jgi:metal-sulfur cluster biosynthetic enzyme
VELTAAHSVKFTMTLTSPACPVAGTLPPEVERKLRAQVEGITDVQVKLVWDPPWNVDMMSDAAKLELGMM